MDVDKLKHQCLDKKDLFNILDSINEYVYLVDENKKIIYANKGAKEKIFNGEDVINKSIFITFQQLNEKNSNIVKVFKNQKPIIGKITSYIDNEGRRRVALSSDYPIIINGKVRFVYEISEDITALNNISKELIDIKNKNRTINKAEDQKEKFRPYYTINSLKGTSENINNVKEKILIFSKSPSNLLIYGETGTGKEIVAQSIYSMMNQKNNIPFIAQNCAAIPENLLESLLFGTVKGAFTGAENKPGLFELVSGGVLFLDEINSMPKSLQAKLLRVLEEGKLRRVGGKKEINIDFRLISSINIKPEVLLNNNEMREDLFYRLNILNIDILPLRRREEDIPLLIEYFIDLYNKKFNKDVIGLDEETMSFLLRHSWPGNVRELKNTIESSIQITKGKLIEKKDIHMLKSAIQKKEYCYNNKERVKLKETIEEIEVKIIKDALGKTNGNISKAARDLDIPNQTLNNKINKYKLRNYISLLK